MMKKSIIFASVIGLVGLQACDDGRLYEQETAIAPEGRTVKLTARLTGIASWPDPSMYVVVAGFNDDSDYALIAATPRERGRVKRHKRLPYLTLHTHNMGAVGVGYDRIVG